MKTIILFTAMAMMFVFTPNTSHAQKQDLKLAEIYVAKDMLIPYLSDNTNPCLHQIIQYRYDALNQLTLYFVSFCDTINAIIYDYDKNGNRTSEIILLFVLDNPSRYRLEYPKPVKEDFESIVKNMLSQLK